MKDVNKDITKEELKWMIQTAFNYGALWGQTYSNRFTPTKEQSDARINQAIKDIFRRHGIEE